MQVILMAAITAIPTVVRAVDTGTTEKDAVARVNGSFISITSYKRQFTIAQQQLFQQGMSLDEDGMSQLAVDVLRNLIDNELLFQEGRKRGYVIDEQAVDEQYEAVQTRFPGEREFINRIFEQRKR